MRSSGRDVSLAGLLAAPRPVEVVGEVPERAITGHLRTLARMQDPVVEAHAGWLVAVLAAAWGVPIDRVGNGGGGRQWTLTPGGRAWLIATALDLIDDDGISTSVEPAMKRVWGTP